MTDRDGRTAQHKERSPMESIHRTMAKSGLVRDDDRWLGGVCAGLARKLGTDPAAVRLVMIMLILMPGSQLVIYPLLWVLMPDAETARRLEGTPPRRVDPGAPGSPQDRA